MKPIRFKSVLLLLFAILFQSTCFATELINRTYWDMAITTAEKQACLMPAHIKQSEHVVDEKGVTQELNLTHLNIFLNNKALGIKLISRIENDQETTKEFEKSIQENKKNILESLKQDQLFNKTMQPKIVITHFAMKNDIAVYAFNLNSEGVTFKGTARINIKNGSAISSEVTADRIKEDKVVITNFAQSMTYKTNGDSWFPERMIQTMELEVKSLFSTFKGVVTEETELSDYFCYKKN